MAQKIVLALSIFLGLFLVTNFFVNDFKYLSFGAGTMLFSATTIFLAVKSILNGTNLVLAISFLLFKYPIIGLLLYGLSKQQDFNIMAYAIGILIVLPCLVIMSYRKPVK